MLVLPFNHLTPDQQAKAVKVWTNKVLYALTTGELSFEGMDDEFQQRIDDACAEASRLMTPWFAGEIIMERCGGEVRDLGKCYAEDGTYLIDGGGEPDPLNLDHYNDEGMRHGS